MFNNNYKVIFARTLKLIKNDWYFKLINFDLLFTKTPTTPVQFFESILFGKTPCSRLFSQNNHEIQ